MKAFEQALEEVSPAQERVFVRLEPFAPGVWRLHYS